MRIIVARRRIRGTLPHCEYCVLIPLDQISLERQNLIHTRSDYGIKGGPWARTPEVIAPMAHLRMSPGLLRYEVGQRINALARRIDTLLVGHCFPEMMATLSPRVFAAGDEHEEATTCIDIDEVTGRFDQLQSFGDALSAATISSKAQLRTAIARSLRRFGAATRL